MAISSEPFVTTPYNYNVHDLGRDMEANYAKAFIGGNTDLSEIERGIHELIEQNGVRVVLTPYGRIEYRGNTKRIIKDA